MIYNSKYCSIVRNSKDAFYKFNIDLNKNLIIQEYSNNKNSFIFKESVLDYSVTIDDYDKIHILYLTLQGNLNYAVYPSNMIDKNLCTINPKNYTIRSLTLKIYSSEVHIFYMLGNKSNNLLWNICHVYWDKTHWEIQKIAEVTAQKYIYPYMLDLYNNEIYLFYSKDSSMNYNIKKFNLNFKIWCDFNKVSLNNAHNVSFFINKKGTALVCYNISIEKNIQIFVRSLDLNKQNTSWSKEKALTKSTVNAAHPSLLNNNNFTYVLWEEGNNIVFSKCEDGKENWSKNRILASKTSTMIYSTYSSNNKEDSSFKSTFILLEAKKQPFPVVNMEDVLTSDNFYIQENTQIKEQIFLPFDTTKQLEELEMKTKYISELHSLLGEAHLNLSKVEEEKLEIEAKLTLLNTHSKTCENKLTDLQKEVENHKIEIEQLRKELKFSLESSEFRVKEFNLIINTLNEEKETLVYDYDNKVNELKEIIKEKDDKLQYTNVIITALKEELKNKDQSIESLEDELNKGFFKKLFKY